MILKGFSPEYTLKTWLPWQQVTVSISKPHLYIFEKSSKVSEENLFIEVGNCSISKMQRPPSAVYESSLNSGAENISVLKILVFFILEAYEFICNLECLLLSSDIAMTRDQL